MNDKYHENDRYPIKGWHDAFNEVSANSIMLYTFWTSTIELDSQTVTLYLSSQRLQKEVSATISLIEFITCDHLMRLAYIHELEQQLLRPTVIFGIPADMVQTAWDLVDSDE